MRLFLPSNILPGHGLLTIPSASNNNENTEHYLVNKGTTHSSQCQLHFEHQVGLPNSNQGPNGIQGISFSNSMAYAAQTYTNGVTTIPYIYRGFGIVLKIIYKNWFKLSKENGQYIASSGKMRVKKVEKKDEWIVNGVAECHISSEEYNTNSTKANPKKSLQGHW